MSANLLNYLHDGADFQSRAVLATLQSLLKYSDLGENPFHVARWMNGREQGYIVASVSSFLLTQLNIVFYEHRNSDDIVALEWKSKETDNIPTPQDLLDSRLYDDEFSDHAHKVGCLEIREMAQWVFNEFWVFHKGAH